MKPEKTFIRENKVTPHNILRYIKGSKHLLTGASYEHIDDAHTEFEAQEKLKLLKKQNPMEVYKIEKRKR
jgi:hypothetical protein